MTRRVVVTGLGAVTPLACGADPSWQRLIKGESGINAISLFDCSNMPSKVAAEVPLEGKDSLNFDDWVEPRHQRRMDRFIIFAIAAASEAVEQSGYKPSTDSQAERYGVMIGSGIGGIDAIHKTAISFQQKGVKGVSPFFIPSALINLASGHVSIKFGLRGPNQASVTACATGAHAIGDAAHIIRRNEADLMLAGGCESAVCPLGVAGFSALRALSTKYNDTPTKASRPWDEGRDGFVIGDGAGVVVLEEYEHAKKRGATIYAEVKGYGMSGDAYHITAPQEEGIGAILAMRNACSSAEIEPNQIDYINAHGTSTPLGDEVEIKALRSIMTSLQDVSISSVKSSIGHTLGAAGAIEAVFSILTLRDQICPPTLNLEEPSPVCEGIDLVPLTAKEKKMKTVLSNSFGFGGTNASLIFTNSF